MEKNLFDGSKGSTDSFNGVSRQGITYIRACIFSSCRHTLRALREGGCSSAECAIKGGAFVDVSKIDHWRLNGVY